MGVVVCSLLCCLPVEYSGRCCVQSVVLCCVQPVVLPAISVQWVLLRAVCCAAYHQCEVGVVTCSLLCCLPSVCSWRCCVQSVVLPTISVQWNLSCALLHAFCCAAYLQNTVLTMGLLLWVCYIQSVIYLTLRVLLLPPTVICSLLYCSLLVQSSSPVTPSPTPHPQVEGSATNDALSAIRKGGGV